MGLIVFWIIILLCCYMLIRYLVGTYNSLVFLKNNCYKAFANIDVLLKKRFDLLPAIVQIADQAMTHEKFLINMLVKSRDTYISTSDLDTKINTVNQTAAYFQKAIIIAENYPHLVSKNTLLELQSQTKRIEDQIADRREFFNQTVTLYNTGIQLFPNVIFAFLFGFKMISLLYAQQEPKQ
ncbi:MAG: LemA family protein [Pseudomonadota bacterium]|uniref:LemA family protein n=1 Tax=Providencia TaxID=586 RepID=UPI00111E200E|nr:LemA family protein [Providencia stuartii]ELR5080774.1 LemA family protein [Providencia stuartii]